MKTKKPNLIIAIVVSVGGVLAVVFWKLAAPTDRLRENILAPESNRDVPTIQIRTNGGLPISNANVVVSWDWTNQLPVEFREAAVARVKKMKQLESLVNVPIVFYGKVVDQFEQPVDMVRVQVACNTSRLPGYVEQRAGRFTNYFQTDITGVFEIRGLTGSGITVYPSKEGYELAPQSLHTFSYGYGYPEIHVPDQNVPVRFKMWKRQGSADLVTRGFEKKVRADGTPISLNLDTDQLVIGGETHSGPTVRVWREPLLFDYQKNQPNMWRYEMTWPPNGKFQITEDVFRYLAPETGYVVKIEETIRKGDPNYRFRDKRLFYFVDSHGKYGNGVLEILADRRSEDALVMLSICWNPDGSRNLEPKPE